MAGHAERRLLPYRPDQLFDLVADIERYPEFLPWCIGARIRRRRGNELFADLAIGFKIYRERFTSHVLLDRPAGHIEVRYSEGPFKYLQNHWQFDPHPHGTLVDFAVEFEFSSKVLQKVIEMLFTEAVRRMVGAFEDRAAALYGPGIVPLGERALGPL